MHLYTNCTQWWKQERKTWIITQELKALPYLWDFPLLPSRNNGNFSAMAENIYEIQRLLPRLCSISRARKLDVVFQKKKKKKSIILFWSNLFLGAEWSPRGLCSSASFLRAFPPGNVQWVAVTTYPPSKGQGFSKSLQEHYIGTQVLIQFSHAPPPGWYWVMMAGRTDAALWHSGCWRALSCWPEAPYLRPGDSFKAVLTRHCLLQCKTTTKSSWCSWDASSWFSWEPIVKDPMLCTSRKNTVFLLDFLHVPLRSTMQRRTPVGMSRHAETASCAASCSCSLPRKADVLEMGAKAIHFCINWHVENP